MIGASGGLEGSVPHRGLVDHQGRLWIAANKGVFRCDLPGPGCRFVRQNPPGTLDKGAWSVSEDRRGVIWVTAPDGWWRASDRGWRHYGKSDGLLSADACIATFGPDEAIYLRHRFDPGMERAEFDGGKLLRSTLIVPAGTGRRGRSRALPRLGTGEGIGVGGGIGAGVAGVGRGRSDSPPASSAERDFECVEIHQPRQHHHHGWAGEGAAGWVPGAHGRARFRDRHLSGRPPPSVRSFCPS